jgi:hypothetical protein
LENESIEMEKKHLWSVNRNSFSRESEENHGKYVTIPRPRIRHRRYLFAGLSTLDRKFLNVSTAT